MRQKKLRFPKPDPYQVALATATARLEMANAEKAECLDRLKELNREIPSLHAIIAVLAPTKQTVIPDLQEPANQLPLPEGVDVNLPPIDLSGLGSLPRNGAEIPQEDNLPEPDGIPVLE